MMTKMVAVYICKQPFLVHQSELPQLHTTKSHSDQFKLNRDFSSGRVARAKTLLSVRVHQKVVGSIPGQGTYLGCRLDPRSGHIREATD